MRRKIAQREAGLTIIELMVVVAIIGILAAVAIPSIRPDQRIGRVSSAVAGKLNEAGRLAATRGPLRASVAVANGGETARARLVITTESSTKRISTSVYVGVEAASPATTLTWTLASFYYMPSSATISGYSTTASLDPGGSPATALDDTDTLTIECRPDGSCDSITLFLQNDDGEKSRIVVMPLNGVPLVFSGW